jgi:hypothetical protein
MRSHTFESVNSLQKALYEAIQKVGHVLRPTVPKSADCHGRDSPASYVYRKGQMTGIVKLVNGWHGIGHTVSNTIITEIHV